MNTHFAGVVCPVSDCKGVLRRRSEKHHECNECHWVMEVDSDYAKMWGENLKSRNLLPRGKKKHPVQDLLDNELTYMNIATKLQFEFDPYAVSAVIKRVRKIVRTLLPEEN